MPVENQGEKVWLTDLIYEDWLEHAFAPEVRIQQAVFSIMTAIGGIRTRPAVAYLTQLFERPGPP